MKSSLDINSIFNAKTNVISRFGGSSVEIILTETGIKELKIKRALSDLWNNIKKSGVYIIGVPESKKRERSSSEVT